MRRSGISKRHRCGVSPISAEGRSLQSFVAQAQRASPAVEGILCIAPVETAAEKLSALTWRVLSRQRGVEGNDPRLIRHFHDLAALEAMVREHSEFPRLDRKRVG